MKTKDGIEVQVGQVWRDLDSRMTGRKVRVLAITETKARVQSISMHGGKTWISIRRMHRHSTGWELETDK